VTKIILKLSKSQTGGLFRLMIWLDNPKRAAARGLLNLSIKDIRTLLIKLKKLQ